MIPPSSPSQVAGSRRAAWTVPFAVMATATLAVLILAAAPSRPDAMAAIYPPWWTPAQAAASAAAEGNLQAVGGARTVLIVASDKPDLAGRLRASGALLLIDSRLASLCAAPANRDPA